MLGPVMNEADAEKIIIAEVKAMLVRRDPLTRLLDDYVRAAIMERNPGIHKYLSNCYNTIYTKYVIPIYEESKKELTSFIAKLPGCINVAMDGATVNSKQKVSTSQMIMKSITS